MYNNGKFIQRQRGPMSPVINRATEEVISEIPAGTAADVDAAFNAAEAAQLAWAKRPPMERAGALRELAQRDRNTAAG